MGLKFHPLCKNPVSNLETGFLLSPGLIKDDYRFPTAAAGLAVKSKYSVISLA